MNPILRLLVSFPKEVGSASVRLVNITLLFFSVKQMKEQSHRLETVHHYYLRQGRLLSYPVRTWSCDVERLWASRGFFLISSGEQVVFDLEELDSPLFWELCADENEDLRAGWVKEAFEESGRVFLPLVEVFSFFLASLFVLLPLCVFMFWLEATTG